MKPGINLCVWYEFLAHWGKNPASTSLKINWNALVYTPVFVLWQQIMIGEPTVKSVVFQRFYQSDVSFLLFALIVYKCVILRYEVHSIFFQTFFVWVFKIVVDSWKFSMLLLYILWNDWPIFMISGSNE